MQHTLNDVERAIVAILAEKGWLGSVDIVARVPEALEGPRCTGGEIRVGLYHLRELGLVEIDLGRGHTLTEEGRKLVRKPARKAAPRKSSKKAAGK